jgi:hypothetical protein
LPVAAMMLTGVLQFTMSVLVESRMLPALEFHECQTITHWLR